MDLYIEWKIDDAVYGLITGHSAVTSIGTVTGAKRNDTIAEVYFDRQPTHLLAAARDVMEHMRTVFVATGKPK